MVRVGKEGKGKGKGKEEVTELALQDLCERTKEERARKEEERKRRSTGGGGVRGWDRGGLYGS